MQVKTGQIWRTSKGIFFAITKMTKNSCYCITKDGTTSTKYIEDFRFFTFVDEFASWQNAVNSKLFKGKDNGL